MSTFFFRVCSYVLVPQAGDLSARANSRAYHYQQKQQRAGDAQTDAIAASGGARDSPSASHFLGAAASAFIASNALKLLDREEIDPLRIIIIGVP